MLTVLLRVGVAVTAVVFLSACGSKGFDDGPDEFAVLPGKPLQSPSDFSSLPNPTPGGGNLTDPTPKIDAAKALGG